mgnify:CR=1 FL=1
MNRVVKIVATAAASVLFALAASTGVQAEGNYNYGQYNPYDNLQYSTGVTPTPAGYTPVYYENIGRHGARAATDSNEINAAISLSFSSFSALIASVAYTTARE